MDLLNGEILNSYSYFVRSLLFGKRIRTDLNSVRRGALQEEFYYSTSRLVFSECIMQICCNINAIVFYYLCAKQL